MARPTARAEGAAPTRAAPVCPFAAPLPPNPIQAIAMSAALSRAALQTAATDTTETPGRKRRRTRWLREPLLHFAVLGGLLFGVDHAINGRVGDPRVIEIDAAVDREAVEVFRSARGRVPNDDELYALRRVWLDNEVLYREGLRLRLDEGDKMIRDRVIFKALSMVNAELKRPAHDEALLRAWFEKNRARYDEPARYDFQEAVLSTSSGATDEAAARTLAATLNAGTSGDARAGLRVFKGRPHDNIVHSYGADFARALESLPLGEWRALPHAGGWRVMRMEALAPPRPAAFEPLAGVVLQDWTDAVMAEQRAAAVRAMAQTYTVKVQPVVPR